ncbi:hypothetical protein WJX77_001626 [Trebouxia sp. C0004]
MARSPRYDDESVEFDEENSWSSQARRNAGLVPSMAGTFLLAANSLGNKLTDIAFDLAPSNVERGTVEIAVKAALILLAVSVAKSLLGVALTLGTVVFGIYVATKVWSKPAADDAAGKPGRMQPGKQRQSRRQDDDGLSDVWFESKSKRKNTRKSQEDSSWQSPQVFLGRGDPKRVLQTTSRLVHVSASSASQVEAKQLSQNLPHSREQAIKQASDSLATQLGTAVPKSKGFQSTGTKKLAVDVPVADQSAPAVAQLVADLLQGLPNGIVDKLTVVFADEDAAQAAKNLQQHAKRRYKAIYLGDAFLDGISGMLLLVGPTKDQVEKVEVLLSQWRGRAAVLLNAEWTPENVDSQYTVFVKSFESVYSFLPLAIQGFIFKTDAIIFKQVTKGTPSASPWFVFVKAGRDHACIARQQQRPTPENLEMAFYNYKASESPITKGVKFFKNIIPQKK